jgi:predicted secreted hydrolase
MQLQLSPILLDQELAFDHMPYWEGAASIDGTVNDLPTSGEAYVELTGYGW